MSVDDWDAAIEAAARMLEVSATMDSEADTLLDAASAIRALRRPEAEPEAGVIRDDAARWAADLAVSAVARGRRHAADGLPLHAAAELEEAAAHAKAAAERLRAIAAYEAGLRRPEQRHDRPHGENGGEHVGED